MQDFVSRVVIKRPGKQNLLVLVTYTLRLSQESPCLRLIFRNIYLTIKIRAIRNNTWNGRYEVNFVDVKGFRQWLGVCSTHAVNIFCLSQESPGLQVIIYCKILCELYVSNQNKTYVGGMKLNSIVIVKWIFFYLNKYWITHQCCK